LELAILVPLTPFDAAVFKLFVIDRAASLPPLNVLEEPGRATAFSLVEKISFSLAFGEGFGVRFDERAGVTDDLARGESSACTEALLAAETLRLVGTPFSITFGDGFGVRLERRTGVPCSTGVDG
jgi:hypothetical protein